MSKNEQLASLKSQLKELNSEYSKIKSLPPEQRRDFGKKLNQARAELTAKIASLESAEDSSKLSNIDLSAPSAPNTPLPKLSRGSKHPLMTELDYIMDIYSNMGFDIIESRQLDNEFNMFEALNFPQGHPARDGYDTFRTAENFIPPAHTSTMQHRALKKYKSRLESDGQIAVVIPGRVFRNEDVDATHEHTFYQCEGVFVSRDATLGQMIGVLRNFFETYYGQQLNIKTQPGFFPFTEPSLEFLIEKPQSLNSSSRWLEVLGCGMIHPNVLELAGISSTRYRGFAWGGGIDRLVMLKHNLSDVRNFESAKLSFLEEF